MTEKKHGKATLNEPMASRQKTTKLSLISKEDAVGYVADLLENSKLDWQSIIITKLEKYEDYCAITVTTESSEE